MSPVLYTAGAFGQGRLYVEKFLNYGSLLVLHLVFLEV